MDDLDNIAKNNDIVLFLHSHDCSHCKKALPVLDEECKNNPSLKFIECPIEKPHCREVAKAAGIKGVPFTAGIKKGENITKRTWEVVGARIPELKGNIKGFSNGATPPPRPPQEQPRPPQVQVPRPPSYDNMIVKMLGDTPQTHRNIAQFNAPKYIEMCVPGKNCSKEDFEQRFVDFYSTNY